MTEGSKSIILIADNDPASVNFFVQLLQVEYTLFIAKNGHDTISAAMNHRPDLILLDMDMPDMAGCEVISALKYMDETKGIPVIFVTGKNNAKAEQQGFQLGIVGCIKKFSDPGIIDVSIENGLSHRAKTPPPTATRF
ncbi:MAG: response regulator [Defluviitaleaceae bacterium]|nr:response regulator [Defluviitaleaceae bacterium]